MCHIARFAVLFSKISWGSMPLDPPLPEGSPWRSHCCVTSPVRTPLLQILATPLQVEGIVTWSCGQYCKVSLHYRYYLYMTSYMWFQAVAGFVVQWLLLGYTQGSKEKIFHYQLLPIKRHLNIKYWVFHIRLQQNLVSIFIIYANSYNQDHGL